jgi:predicted Rdx family selenoprotein
VNICQNCAFHLTGAHMSQEDLEKHACMIHTVTYLNMIMHVHVIVMLGYSLLREKRLG